MLQFGSQIVLFILYTIPSVFIVNVGARFLVRYFPSSKQYRNSKFWFIRWLGITGIRFGNTQKPFEGLPWNPYLSSKQLGFLSKRVGVNSQAFLVIASNPKIPVKALQDMVSKRSSLELRQVLLSNVSIPEETRTFWAIEWDMV